MTERWSDVSNIEKRLREALDEVKKLNEDIFIFSELLDEAKTEKQEVMAENLMLQNMVHQIVKPQSIPEFEMNVQIARTKLELLIRERTAK